MLDSSVAVADPFDGAAILQEPAYREIIVGARGQYVAKVSPEDYGFLICWRWTFKKSRGGNIYARRGGGRVRSAGELRPTILMHNVIMELKGEERPSPEHTVDHRNRCTLDNTRGNLQWADKSAQNKNRNRKRRR